MRKTKIVAAIILVILMGAWFLFQSPDQYGPNQPLVKEPVEMASEHESKQKSEVIDTKQPALTPEELLDANPKLQKIKQIQQAANRQMDFYGRVVDQYGDPVAGAEVAYRYAYYPDTTLPTFSWSVRNDVTTTNTLGKFKIETARGVHLTIADIRKPGYAVQASQVFQYRPRTVDDVPFASDPADPVIFHAWKKTEVARELKRGEQRKIYRADGQFRELPISESKDAFQIAFENLDTTVSADASDRPKWRVHLKANGGGLIETHDAFTFETPEAGYLQDWEAVSEENRDIEKTFYIKTPEGNYGRLNVKLIGYYGNDPVSKQRGYIRYQYVLNPTGSRNLLSEKD